MSRVLQRNGTNSLCVCVCERERERERDRDRDRDRERERERGSERDTKTEIYSKGLAHGAGNTKSHRVGRPSG